MFDIFLSYRSDSGSEFASFLCKELTDLGYTVFFDAKNLREGEFEPKIDAAIDQCTFFLLLLAPNDLDRCFQNPEKDWILHESGRALKNGKCIIPISIKRDFKFPENCELDTINELSKINICDLSGVHAAELIQTRLLSFMNDSPAKKLSKEYNNGITSPDYIEWELNTLKSIYHDIPFVKVFGKEYPAYVVKGADSVTFPFESLSENGTLNPIAPPLLYEETPWFNDFKKIVGPNIHYPDLYGYTSNGFKFDDEGNICGMYCTPRTYKESVYTCHILQYELWAVYQKIGKERYATLDDLPMRKKIHQDRSNYEIITSGCNRSALNDVTIAVVDYNEQKEEYCIATALRSENVATFPGYFSFIPSGGYELYELESNQNESVIKENFSVIGALYREYIEELFGDKDFGKATGDDDLNRLYKNSKIRNIKKGIRAGTYKFEFLGVDFDLITLRQTLAFVLRIDDENFFYDNEFKKNEENIYVKFEPLNHLEEYIVKNNIPTMVETAATFALLKEHNLYKEIEAHNFRMIPD